MKKNNNALIISAIFIYASLTIIYYIWFSLKLKQPLSSESSSWGQFGDFVGGIANPLFSLFALLALIRTLEISREGLIQSEKHNITIMYEQAIMKMAEQFEKDLFKYQNPDFTELDPDNYQIIQHLQIQNMADLLDAIRITIEKGYKLGLIMPFSDYFVWKYSLSPKWMKMDNIRIDQKTIDFYLNGSEKFNSEPYKDQTNPFEKNK
ncbi:hypothetical protein EHQ76_06870 [Leptospira barantonii]|uniref:Uncharacterized protein n=1 Tax=Leptospira barantonii TaxID=2023184 RepID=A0A5F2BK90_9LEPT|nr:hypothetical protein [Leptospira barantonii]TGM05983.1 hypothetical protein EHQ76_06870 [Leptospira barantonii]